MRRLVSGVAGLGVAGLGYARLEAAAYRLREVEVPVLAPGARPLRVLHVSDLHATPSRKRLHAWVRDLDRLEPDLVVDTGDNLAHPAAAPWVLDMLAPLLERPGLFVLGSNDYYAPRLKNPVRYLRADDGTRVHGPELPWRELVAGFTGRGWHDLTNAHATLDVAGTRITARGVDDPHLRRDRYQDVAAADADSGATLVLGVTHSPEPRVLDAMTDDGVRLVLAGHTHGGQLCLPGIGALVTNCGLPRGQAKGLSRWGPARLHVSAGLGTSPYTPFRFACPPEATLLTLVAARVDEGASALR